MIIMVPNKSCQKYNRDEMVQIFFMAKSQAGRDETDILAKFVSRTSLDMIHFMQIVFFAYASTDKNFLSYHIHARLVYYLA